jgi:hypothetical protein
MVGVKERPRMAKKKIIVEEESGSSSVRLASDLARMVKWICEIEKLRAHELLDPLVRPQITARFERIREKAEEIERIKLRAQAEIEKIQGRGN